MRSLLALTVVICVAVGAAPAAAAAGSRSCAKAGSRTVEQNSQVRVYETGPPDGSRLWACRRATGRRLALSEISTDATGANSLTYRDVFLAGRHVAWASTRVDRDCRFSCPDDHEFEQHRVWVTDAVARRSREIRANPAPGALVLSRNGGVAWAGAGAEAGSHEIHVSMREGDDRVLDSGAIDPRTLDIEITIISWMHGAEERFARLR